MNKDTRTGLLGRHSDGMRGNDTERDYGKCAVCKKQIGQCEKYRLNENGKRVHVKCWKNARSEADNAR